MKTKELINKLSKIDGELDVICYTEDEEIVSSKDLFRIFEIIDVDVSEAKKVRQENETPSLKFEKSDLSEKHAMINLTSIF